MEEVELQLAVQATQADSDDAALAAESEKLKQQVRLPTGLIMPDVFVSTLESTLATNCREKRIQQAISKRNTAHLLMDLTPRGLQRRFLKSVL